MIKQAYSLTFDVSLHGGPCSNDGVGLGQRNARMNLRAQFTQVGEVADPDLKKVHIEEELSSPVEKKKRVPNVSKVSTVLHVWLGSKGV
jgi:hypothetical protein